jgi:hypothetical protein
MLSALGAGGPSLVADSVRVILVSCAIDDMVVGGQHMPVDNISVPFYEDVLEFLAQGPTIL